MTEAAAHLQAELRIFDLASYEEWAPQVAERIRPAMAMWDESQLDPIANPLEEIICPYQRFRYNYWGLYADEELKAFAELSPGESDTVILLNLAVPPAAQRQGWGSALLALCEVRAWEAGYTQLTLLTPPGSRAFYEKHEYAPYASRNEQLEIDAGRRDVSVHMIKQLHPFRPS